MFIFVLTQKRTKKVKTAIFDVQLPFHALKRLNDSHTLTNLFYACFNGLKLVCKSYVAFKIRYKKWIWILKKELKKFDDLESKCNSTLNYWNKKSWSVWAKRVDNFMEIIYLKYLRHTMAPPFNFKCFLDELTRRAYEYR